MLRSKFREAYLSSICNGVSPATIASGQSQLYFQRPNTPKPSKSKHTFIYVKVPPLPCVRKQIPVEPIKENNQTLKEVKQEPKPLITAMDIDVTKRRMEVLKKLAGRYGDDYFSDNLNYYCQSPSKKGLKLARGTFYKLFGTEAKARELISQFIATLAGSGNPLGVEIINGLIKYFEKFTKWLDDNQSNFAFKQLRKPNKLFEKYLRFGRDEVYKLIESIAVKIQTKCKGIKNENIFPVICQDINKIFGSLQPVRFP